MMKIIFTFCLMLIGFGLSAQTASGVLVDADSGTPLIGANVILRGTTLGTISDIDGKFQMNIEDMGATTLEISYVGYKTILFNFDAVAGNNDLGTISLGGDAMGLDAVVVTGVMDIVRDRRTPVAVSTITAAEIQAKSGGNVELTEVAKATPSVYIANQSGGYGDSEVFTRGFDQTNTAFLLNGQPINGMEDGKMYWSNWSGLTDVASAIQIQRGLGASKLAISSVGGTWNFIMKATDLNKGGTAGLTLGNNNYQKATVSYNTGMINDKFGVSVLLSHWSGDGWANGAKGAGQTYFISAGYKPSDKHTFNFLLTGAPQFHDQNFNKSLSSYYNNAGELNPRYNSNWGLYDGNYFTERRNYYHKPVMNINWDFDINDKSRFSTVLYASWGRGGGTGSLGRGRVRTESGQINFDAIAAAKLDSGSTTTYIRRESVNMHSWYGAVLNYEMDLTDNITFSVGGDLRSYSGDHFRQVNDLIGSDFYAQRGSTRYPNGIEAKTTYEADPWAALFDFAPEGDRIAYNNAETINYGGVFGQLEYANDAISAYVQGAFSNQTHVRFEKFYATEADEESEKISNPGFNVKGGLSYSINDNNSIFVNSGLYSRQPFHDNVFVGNSNVVSIAAENEEVIGLELGYKFFNSMLSANVNLYRTEWNNRINTQYYRDGEVVEFKNGKTFDIVGEGYTNTKQNQLHQGIELDFALKATNNITIRGFGSVGDWVVNGDASVELYDDNRSLVDSEVLSGEFSVDGRKIGGAAQTSMGLGFKYKFNNNFSSELSYIHYSKLYARVSSGELELPSFGVMDLNLGYTLPLDNGNLIRFGANVYNLLDLVYISQANSANKIITAGPDVKSEDVTPEADIWYGENDQNTIGVNKSNRVRFGKTRTWNVSMKYIF